MREKNHITISSSFLLLLSSTAFPSAYSGNGCLVAALSLRYYDIYAAALFAHFLSPFFLNFTHCFVSTCLYAKYGSFRTWKLMICVITEFWGDNQPVVDF
jgi:hypothetical protein